MTTPEPPKRRSWVSRVTAPVGIIVFAMVGAQWLIESRPTVSKAELEVKATSVDVFTARVQDERATIVAYGSVTAHRELMVQPEVGGRVVKLNPDLVIGGVLGQGDVLLQIDPRDYQFAVNGQEASLAKAEFDLQVELGNQAVAAREWKFLEPSKSEISALSKQLALRRPHLKEKTIALEAAKSRFRKARLDLQRTVIQTPFNALVIAENVELGQRIDVGKSVATLIGTDEFRVQVSMPIHQLDWVTFPTVQGSPGSKVRVIRETGNGSLILRQGVVMKLLGDVTQNGRMAQVLVTIPDPLERAKPPHLRQPLLLGEYVKVEIEGPVLHDVISVPREAIREGMHVWVSTPENTLDIRKVQPALLRKDSVLINEGLKDGELVIVSQLPAAVPGLRLNILGGLMSPPTALSPSEPSSESLDASTID